MSKWLVGLMSSLACLFLLSAALVAIIAVMYAVSYSPLHLWKMLIVPPLAIAGAWLLHKLDKEM